MNRIALCVSTLLLTCTFASGQQYKVLYNFGSGSNDGIIPLYNPVMDKAGNLYGVTQAGGAPGTCFGGCGIVWELSPNGSAWSETILYTFCEGGSGFDCPDGGSPNGLIIDSAGNLFGTTTSGGSGYDGGEGVAFELSPPSALGGTWTYTVLYNFCSIWINHVCDDGAGPYGALTTDAAGNLYGTTISGGANGGGYGGLVFELSSGASGWSETILYNFCALQYCADSSNPEQGVTFDKHGNLYGTTTVSGYGSDECSVTCGALFELSPGANGWTLKILAWFPAVNGAPGQAVWPGPVSIDPANNLYTTVTLGGNYNVVPEGNGSVWKVTPSGKQQTFLFDYYDGSNPGDGVLVDAARGVIYGVTFGVGENNFPGNVFQIDRSGKESVLYTFCRLNKCLDGLDPSGLYKDSAGNLFGVASDGGANGQLGDGVVFEIARQ